MKLTRVVNKLYDPFDVDIGRGSLFGNPFEIGRDGDRSEVIQKHKEWFDHLIHSPIFKQEVLKLINKRLGCYCKQKDEEVACHGDVIVEWLNNYLESSKEIWGDFNI